MTVSTSVIRFDYLRPLNFYCIFYPVAKGRIRFLDDVVGALCAVIKNFTFLAVRDKTTAENIFWCTN